MNTENLKVLIAHLESPQNPIGWNMGAFFDHNGVEVYGANEICEVVEEHACGTAACLAGHAAWLAWTRGDTKKRKGFSPEEVATEWLELEKEEADHLFYGRWSPNSYMSEIQLDEAITHLKTLIPVEGG